MRVWLQDGRAGTLEPCSLGALSYVVMLEDGTVLKPGEAGSLTLEPESYAMVAAVDMARMAGHRFEGLRTPAALLASGRTTTSEAQRDAARKNGAKGGRRPAEGKNPRETEKRAAWARAQRKSRGRRKKDDA